MVDVGLYAITPYQFRIAHELNIDNFLSPKVEDRHILDPTDTNQQSSPNADVLYHPEYHSQNVFNSKDKPFGANTTRKDVCTDEVESGGFTLTLTRRPEKRERSRSGSDVLSPEPKRVGPGHDEDICTTTEQHVCLDNNGNNSPNRSDGDSGDSPNTPIYGQMDKSMFTSFNSDDVIVIVRNDMRGDAGKECENSLTDSCHSNDSTETPKCQQSSDDLRDHVEDSGSQQTVVMRKKRRPRKLPEIPASVQRKSVACIMRTNSLADELSDADPRMRKTQRALKSQSWIESTRHSSSSSSQESGTFYGSFLSMEELGSPEVVDPEQVEQVHKEIVELAMSQSQCNLEEMFSQPQTPGAAPATSIPHSMSMSLRDELESEGIPINNDLGSAFCDHTEFIDDEMPKLERYFGEDIGSQNTGTVRSGRYEEGMGRSAGRSQRGDSNTHRQEGYGEGCRAKSSNWRNQSPSSPPRDNYTAGSSSRHSSSSSCYSELEAYDATHRGCHKFVTRHDDEMFIEIGDLIFVEDEADDLWCEGINLRTGQRGIFPAAYATDLSLLEVDGISKFKLRFLGSVEVSHNKGNDVICKAIQRVVTSRRDSVNLPSPPLYCLEINEYGIKMIDLSKKGKRNSPKKSSIRERLAKILNKEYKKEESNDLFFSLKNVSFCGYHPKNERYFAFVTKHPMESRFACHVFLSHRSTRPIGETIGCAFKKFYQEYMAFMHPTEDIYME